MILLRKTKGITIKASFKLSTIFIVLFTFFGSINGNAETGEKIFKTNCAACHNLSDQKLVGPGLKGISEKHSEEWLISWIKNSQELIASGDSAANAIFNEFNKMPMQSFPQFSNEEIVDLINYMKTNESVEAKAIPIKEKTQNSESNIDGNSFLKNIFIYSVIIVLALMIFYLIKIKVKINKTLKFYGYFDAPHKIKNFPKIFFYYIIATSLVIYLLYYWLSNDTGMINTIMFIVVPYVAIAIFIIGSVYRYTQKGFKVSSLSSQFIEGRKLFWGSQPFHWGILILFVGHLIAFLFPSAILAWNGSPVRLLILEVSAFAFGLSALLGVLLLVKRRLTTKTLLVVANKMDMLVYITLLTQIISGLGVAFFVRWGSSWFSSVLTPYLRSIFSLNPDIDAVAEMPILVQLHIISAFFIIAIIPFSRFMHFLVAPIDYIWRKYQVVIWNWDKSAIRKSTKHTFGKESRNH